MKKSLICFAVVLMVILGSSVTVFASETGSTEPSQNINLNQDPSGSVQRELAILQLQRKKEIARQEAQKYMEEVEALQEEQRLTAQHLETANKCREEAMTSGRPTEMSADLAVFMVTRELDDRFREEQLLTADDWDYAIKLITNYQKQVVGAIAIRMEKLEAWGEQDPTAVKATQAIPQVQSMYGDSEAGLVITSLVLGLVMGCAATLAVQKMRRKKAEV